MVERAPGRVRAVLGRGGPAPRGGRSAGQFRRGLAGGLWDGIASRLDGSSPPSWEGLAGRLGSVTTAPTGSGRGWRRGHTCPEPDRGAKWSPGPNGAGGWRVDVVAAAAAVVAVRAGRPGRSSQQPGDALRARTTLTGAEQAAMADPSTKKVTLASGRRGATPSGVDGKVTVVLTRSGTGFVEGAGLSALPPDRDLPAVGDDR